VDLPFCSLRRGEGRRLAAEASSFSPPVALEVSVERLDVALVLAEGVREIGVASPVARGALGVRVLVLGVARVRARAFEFPLAPTLRHAFLVGCDWRELGRRRVNPPREVPLGALVFEDFAGQDAHARRGGRQGERGEAASFHLHVCACRATKEARRGDCKSRQTGADVFIETARQLKNGCHKQKLSDIKIQRGHAHARALLRRQLATKQIPGGALRGFLPF
jgi:hypothetical protein